MLPGTSQLSVRREHACEATMEAAAWVGRAAARRPDQDKGGSVGVEGRGFRAERLHARDLEKAVPKQLSWSQVGANWS